MPNRWAPAVAIVSLAILLLPGAAMAACLGAVANLPARIFQTGLQPAAAPANSARITFVGHATFLIETPQGVTAATDYNDYLKPAVIPDIVTMNHAHMTHFTNQPEAAIRHVLRGWPHEGKPARHNLQYRDMRVRNVPTNIRSYGGETEFDGNSIFIFDVAGLCIAHLGHLHHELAQGHLADLGRIDVLFVPVDGGFTLNIAGMRRVIEQVDAPLVIPMHYFSEATLERFLAQLRDTHEIRLNDSGTTVVSRSGLPARPTVLILPGPH